MIQYGKAVEEKGYRLEAFIPENPDELLQFVVRIYNARTGELAREMTSDIEHDYIHGVDCEDNKRLDANVDIVMAELPDISGNK